ncbi:hypothetical protein EDC01DRAFT_721967 [Geopyxis carbonaria]|nr:hypothetical protein EDC01DRAFT_721967 [Geopyxis carbonaria]
MKAFFFITLLASSLLSVTLGWSKEDHEIFRIRDELELAEGEGVTFYDFLRVPKGPSANIDEINKAYKKTSIKFHPDKHRPLKGLNKREIAASKKKAHERFTRLGIVATILRGPERERYDHFLKNGFPKWRGSGYYYARFRPGLGTVLIGIWLMAGGMHYVILHFNAQQQRKHIQSYINEARAAAGVPGLSQEVIETPANDEDSDAAAPARNRRERRAQKDKKGTLVPATSSGNATPVGPPRRKVFAENGKPFIVDSVGNVSLLHVGDEGQEEFLLDVNEVEGAKLKNTCLVTLPKFFWRISIGRFIGGKGGNDEYNEELVNDESDSSAENGARAAPKKKGIPKKLENTDGAPRRRVKPRGKK